MYSRVLVAIDDSDTSQRALQEAVSLAGDQGAALRVVCVVDEASLFGNADLVDPTAIEAALVQAGRALLARAQASAQAAGVTVETRMLETDRLGESVSRAIIEDARNWPADLIVVGTHGRKGFRHFLVGSVAEGVIRESTVPILLIRGY